MAGDAARLIRALQASGLTQREIGRRINRGPSYVSKVATGRKPGGGLEPGLRALQRGSHSFHVPRRRAASGRLAHVRGESPESQSARVGYPRSGSGRGGVSSGPSVRAWRDGGGWHDLQAGGAMFTPSQAGDVTYVLLDIPGIGLRQFAVEFTDEYDLDDLWADVLAMYGEAA
jgi:transcriptional regulator with XRE-family HTH domain